MVQYFAFASESVRVVYVSGGVVGMVGADLVLEYPMDLNSLFRRGCLTIVWIWSFGAMNMIVESPLRSSLANDIVYVNLDPPWQLLSVKASLLKSKSQHSTLHSHSRFPQME